MEIKTNFLAGGSGLTPQGAGADTVTKALRDIADDLAGLKPAQITSADADATYGSEEAALINEMKAALNALYAYVIKTTKGT